MIMIPERHGQTDGQTDGRLTVALPRSALASRGKNPGYAPAHFCFLLLDSEARKSKQICAEMWLRLSRCRGTLFGERHIVQLQ